MLIPLLLMPFSFGEGMALSLRCFLLSLIPEMDHPQPSCLAAFADTYFNGPSSVSPYDVGKVALTLMDIIFLVEY